MLDRAIATSVFFCLCTLLLAAELLAAEPPKAVTNELHDTEELIRQVEAAIQIWSDAGDRDLVSSLQVKVDELRRAISDKHEFAVGDDAELHAVVLGEGINAPTGVLSGRDRFALGYAKVNVTFTKRPVVLLLSSTQPIYWDVELAPGVSIKAAVVWNRGRDKSRVKGLPTGTLVSTQRPNDKWYVFARDRDDPNYLEFQEMAEIATGMAIKTFQASSRFDDAITIGPSGRLWRLEYVRDAAIALHREVVAKQQQKVLQDFAHLRFRGTYALSAASRHHRGSEATALANFNLLGPLEGTIENNRYPVYGPIRVAREKTQFALLRNRLIMIEEGREPTQIPVGRVVHDRRFTGLCYDENRHRMLVAGTDRPFSSNLYEYDFGKNEWSKLFAVEGTLFGIVFDALNDRMLGIVQKPTLTKDDAPIDGGSSFSTGGVSMLFDDFRRMPVALVEVDQRGGLRTIAELKLSYVVRADNVMTNNGYQLAVADRQHAVLLTPKIRQARNQYKAFLTLLDTEAGTDLYTGTVRRHDGTTTALAPEHVPPPQGGGELAEFWKQQAKVDDAVAQAAETDAARLPELRRRLAQIQTELAGSGEKSDKPQLHWIGLYEGPRATVRVTETRHPVVLALTTNENVSWTVEADEGVVLQRIIVVGSDNPEVASAPKGVDVEIFSRRRGNRISISVHEKHHYRYRQAAAKLEEITGLEVATFHGNYAGGEFEIGPPSAQYLMQRAMAALKQLEKDALAGALSRRVAELASVTFPAVYRQPVDLPKNGGPAAIRRLRFQDARRYLAEFTLRGPVRGTFEEVSTGKGEVISDPADPRIRYIHNGKVSRIGANGEVTELQMDPNLPRISWGDSIAVDNKRRRLLLTSHGGSGHFYAFDLQQDKWSLLRTPGLSASAITYVPDEDALYGVNVPMGEPVLDTLRKYKADGELVREVKIVPPILLTSHGFRGNTAQLRYGQGHAFVIISRLPKSVEPAGRRTEALQVPWVHVVDAESGEVIYDGKLKPHAGRRSFSQQQLQDLWDEAELTNLDSVAWTFASGHNDAVRFLSKKFSSLTPEYDEALVDRLIAELDDPRFRTRMAASGQLKQLGRKIQPKVERHLRTDPSGEVRARLRELINAWQNEVPLTAQEKREAMAITALQRIGTAAAVATLREISEGPEWATRTARAKAALAELEDQD